MVGRMVSMKRSFTISSRSCKRSDQMTNIRADRCLNTRQFKVFKVYVSQSSKHTDFLEPTPPESLCISSFSSPPTTMSFAHRSPFSISATAYLLHKHVYLYHKLYSPNQNNNIPITTSLLLLLYLLLIPNAQLPPPMTIPPQTQPSPAPAHP